jgi:hypothetical protein
MINLRLSSTSDSQAQPVVQVVLVLDGVVVAAEVLDLDQTLVVVAVDLVAMMIRLL